MTEQQIEQLKSLLADSSQQENSNQLDERILLAAKQTAQERHRFHQRPARYLLRNRWSDGRSVPASRPAR